MPKIIILFFIFFPKIIILKGLESEMCILGSERGEAVYLNSRREEEVSKKLLDSDLKKKFR